MLCLRVEIIGQSLCRAADCINIHPIGTRAKHAAQAGCPKRQIPVKPIKNFVVLSLDRLKLGDQVCILKRMRQPTVIQLHMVHIAPSYNIMIILKSKLFMFSYLYDNHPEGQSQLPV